MAVYKATYCYPFLGSCDIRVAPGETQWITCKVDSSNKKITGYRITIYDENNNLIFPHYDPSSDLGTYHKKDWNISPISELSYGGVLPRDEDGNLVVVSADGTVEIKLPSQEYLTNSGMNGSYLNLPFFQNQNGKVTTSANAVYYQPRYQAEYLIWDVAEEDEDYNTPENSSNWAKHSDGRYYYNKKEDNLALRDDLGFFAGKLNGDSKLRPYQTVLFYAINVFFVGHLCYEDNVWSIVKDHDVEKAAGTACVITRGEYHDRVYVADPTLKEYAGDLWHDALGNAISFSIGKAYKWVITLYQGDGAETSFGEAEAAGKLVDYSNIDVSEWYDMVLQKGQILGSCPSRIQIAKYDTAAGEYLLPKNKDGSSVILYKKYAQLVASNGNDVGSRFYVNTYSSSLGHVYPLESDAGTINVEGADSVEFFEHSNNPEAILDTDMVDMASVKEHLYNEGDAVGNVELCGLQNIDDVVGDNGQYVLVMYQKNPAENGVYKMTADSDNTISVEVTVTTTNNGEATTGKALKNYKRDPSGDRYNTDGTPFMFAWTHEKTEQESNQEFKLAAYTTSRYCKKDGDVLIGDDSSLASHWRTPSDSYNFPVVINDFKVKDGSDYPRNEEQCYIWKFGDPINVTSLYERDTSCDIYSSSTGKIQFACFVYIDSGGAKLSHGYPLDNVLVPVSGSSFEWDSAFTIGTDRDLLIPGFAKMKISSAKMATWIRAGGYTSWSNYIGKIIYVSGGDKNGGKNFASTAAAGGTLLKKPYAGDQDTSTPLYFVPERSVVLFPQLLNNDYSIKALGEFKAGDGSLGDTVDGVILSSGDYYIKQGTGEIWQYTDPHTEGKLIKSPGANSEYYYINQGQTNGLQVCKTGENKLVDPNSKDLNRAEVLKNTATKTYIGQYINLDTDMVLKFDDKVVRAQNGPTPKNYLKIQKVDKVVWSVEHEALTAPFRSYSSDANEPYYYKICTFYKKSDENPFYFRETPYLIINDGLADGYTKDDDYGRLSVYPAESGGTFGDTEVGYDLNIGSVFSGTPSEALEKLSYSKEALAIGKGSDGISIINRIIDFKFPHLSEDGQTWNERDSTFSFNFGPKIDNIDAASIMEQKIIDTYKDSTKKAIDVGEDGFWNLSMPEALRTAAKTKWKEPPTESKENFFVLTYSPVSESGYKLSLNGLYKQGNGASWESYRWVLEKVRFDSMYNNDQVSTMIKNGDPELFSHIAETIVIKDTGNKHDKQMNAVFYGLLDNLENSDDSSNIVGVGGKTLFSNIYLVTLYVTDENGITESEKRLFEYKTPAMAFDYCIRSFEATMDCQKECAKISIFPEFIDSSHQLSTNTEFSYLKEFSVFRREYKKLYRYNNGRREEKTLVGNRWDPVVLNLKTVKAGETISPISLLDFNVKSGYSYQYVIFPGDYSALMQRVPYIYANTGKAEDGMSIYGDNSWKPFLSRLSKPVRSTLQYWSIVNLVPIQEDSQIGTDIDTYVADTDNVWLFKYQLENGSLTQNISKNEFSTLGQYSKIGVGRKNFLSGSVSCYLGSEIIPLSKVGYIERTPASRKVPLSTNEKAFMVEKWRELVATGTPKLLRDTKGQSWIVQIMDGTTTTNESISIKPDTINFSWRQIADTSDAIIYARQDQTDPDEVCSDEWQEDLNYE